MCTEVLPTNSILPYSILSGKYVAFFYLVLHWPMWQAWRRQWHPTPVFLPRKSDGWRSLVGCSPRGREESDTTERLHFHISLSCIWRRKWQPTPVFLPGESQGWGNLVGCRLWGRTELDTTEETQQQQQQQHVKAKFSNPPKNPQMKLMRNDEI